MQRRGFRETYFAECSKSQLKKSNVVINATVLKQLPRVRWYEAAEEVCKFETEPGNSTEHKLNQPNETECANRFWVSIATEAVHFVEQLP